MSNFGFPKRIVKETGKTLKALGRGTKFVTSSVGTPSQGGMAFPITENFNDIFNTENEFFQQSSKQRRLSSLLSTMSNGGLAPLDIV